MSVICNADVEDRPATRSAKEHGNVLLVKGAAECVLARCHKVYLNSVLFGDAF